MKRTALVLAVLALCLGCSRRYRVTDPASGAVYYTRDVDKRDSGAAEFTDAKTKANVTLVSSVVVRITKEEFFEEVGSK
ncbi:MAG: hypothetical protein ACHQ1G_06235 [Planctomycetota bacterium]